MSAGLISSFVPPNEANTVCIDDKSVTIGVSNLTYPFISFWLPGRPEQIHYLS